jgi:hypothetical protein
VLLQPCPARKSIFASNYKLRVTQAELSVEKFRVRSATEARVKFPDPLGCRRNTRSALFQQIPGLRDVTTKLEEWVLGRDARTANLAWAARLCRFYLVWAPTWHES